MIRRSALVRVTGFYYHSEFLRNFKQEFMWSVISLMQITRVSGFRIACCKNNGAWGVA